MIRILKTFIVLNFIMLFACFFAYQPLESTTEMVISVESEAEALKLQTMYQIELIDYSNFGYAIYQANHTQIDFLSKNGFEINQTLQVIGGPFETTDDPFMDDQYALNLMDVTEAWTLTEGSSDVVIAIIDTGIDIDHEEFQGRIMQNSYNARTKETSEISLSHIEDDNGHGTMVAGIIGANKDNSKGIAGIVQHAKLLIIKANNVDKDYTAEDESEQFSESTVAEAIHYARINGADIINLSLGTDSTNTVTANAIQQAIDAGIIIIGASGNDGDQTKYYPASYPGVISVGSIDDTLTISSFSNHNDAVDFTAPGSFIVSTSLNNGYMNGSGTSFAAPQVTGVVALMISYYPSLSSDAIISQLTSTAIDRGTIGYDHYYGYGVINAAKAMQVNFVTVSFNTDGGTEKSSIQVVSGYSFYITDPVKEGHKFLGWYKDSNFLVPFQIGIDTVNESITLYAKYQKNKYQVALVVDEMLYQTIEVEYESILDLPNPVEPTGYDFVGWYYQVTYQNRYNNEPVTSSFTLYAMFEREVYTITYYSNQIIYKTEQYPFETTPEPPTPPSLFTFLGWYYENTFVTRYEAIPITTSFNLYARYHDGSYTVTFYDADHITVLSTTQVHHGFNATPPDEPDKPNTPSFSYTFIGWSEDYQSVTRDLQIYPLYEKTYLKDSVVLLPGLDTVTSFDSWIDGGVTLVDNLLTLEKEIEQLGESTYKITYKIMDDENEIDRRYRMVTVRNLVDVKIDLLPGVATIEVGDTYQEAGAISNIGEVEITSLVDSSKSGVYEVLYTVSFQDKVYQRTRFIYVLDKDNYHPIEIIYYRKEEGWWML